MTGETGAGKSILIGALKLLLGERADKSAIRAGCDQGAVEAVFQLPDSVEMDALLEENGVDACEDGALLLRRTISASGPSRQFINGCACPLSILKLLGERLVDLHGPHDHQSLFAREEQTRLLDDFANAGHLRESYADKRRNLLEIRRAREDLSADDQALRREAEMLAIQVHEIEDAGLDAAEEEPLLARHRAASNARRLGELCGDLVQRLSEGEDNVLARLTETARLLRDLARLDPRMEAVAEEHAGAVAQLESVSRGISECALSLESDPESVRTMEDRLDLIQALKRKYGSTLDEVIGFGASAAERLASIENREERLAAVEKQEAEALAESNIAADKLRAARKKAAPKLAKQIVCQLGDLGFRQAGFEIQFEPIDPPGPFGSELAEFLFAPNPGEPAAPLRSIASSGEISRVMLALKTALAAQDRVPLLVFDEIDANVGGEIAHSVAAKMVEIGRAHQVICITHLPQVAAAASTHFVVTKVVRDGRTYSELNHVADDRRREEIARMLGGKSASALTHADELLGTSSPKNAAAL